MAAAQGPSAVGSARRDRTRPAVFGPITGVLARDDATARSPRSAPTATGRRGVACWPREPIFHRLELGTTRADFEAQTSPDFWEVGASGAIYDRETVWSVLEARYADAEYAASDSWETSGFDCRRIARTPTC